MDNEITVIEAYEKINGNEDIALLDLRSAQDFEKKSIPGFENLPFAKLSADLGEFDGKRQTYLLCEDGTKSHQARQLLEACGYTATVIRGGMKDWETIIEPALGE